MQEAMDSFYVALRDRLLLLNPERTVVVRGAVRPAVLVAENELATEGDDPLDAFVLRWSEVAVDTTEPLPLHRAMCEVRYRTEGSREVAGVDRGRVLHAMDRELRAVLLPGCTAKVDYSATPALVKQTAVFWSEPSFGAVEAEDEWVSRSATVAVFALEEVAG